jgi:hypothetical protein
MSLICIDHSAGKLFFAGDFLSFLNNLKLEVKLLLPDSNQKNYVKFLSFFKNITPVGGNFNFTNKDIIIDFIDSPGASLKFDQNRHLIFPIITKNEIENYRRFVNNQHYNDRLQYVHIKTTDLSLENWAGNSDCAGDMLLRMLNNQDLKDKKILISAGPTSEDIDPVRYLTNRSTGKMGVALARAAYIRGADVHLTAGTISIDMPGYLNVTHVRSAAQMTEAVMESFNSAQVYIAVAAVADFTPDTFRQDKIKKQKQGMVLKLKRTTDILTALQEYRTNQIMIGFSIETTDVIKNSLKKLREKNLDLVVLNNPKEEDSGFAADTNLVTLLFKNGNIEKMPLMSKFKAADIILNHVLNILKSNQHG